MDCLFFLQTRYPTVAAIAARPTTPPTVAPAIAPVCDELDESELPELDVAVLDVTGCDDVDVVSGGKDEKLVEELDGADDDEEDDDEEELRPV